jgi:flagellin
LRSASAITITGSSVSSALGFSTTSISVDTTNNLSTISLSTQNSSSDALAYLDATLAQLNSLRSSLGAIQSRLDSTVNSLSVTLENVSSARSQIRETDVASETAELTRAQILQQAGVAVLGQANQSTTSALRLLQNI